MESWEYQGGTFTAVGNWIEVGGKRIYNLEENTESIKLGGTLIENIEFSPYTQISGQEISGNINCEGYSNLIVEALGTNKFHSITFYNLAGISIGVYSAESKTISIPAEAATFTVRKVTGYSFNFYLSKGNVINLANDNVDDIKILKERFGKTIEGSTSGSTISGGWCALPNSKATEDCVIYSLSYKIKDGLSQLKIKFVKFDNEGTATNVRDVILNVNKSEDTIEVSLDMFKGEMMFIYGHAFSNAEEPSPYIGVAELSVGTRYATMKISYNLRYSYINSTYLYDKVIFLESRVKENNLAINTVGSEEEVTTNSTGWTAIIGSEFPQDSIVTKLFYNIQDNVAQSSELKVELALMTLDQSNTITSFELLEPIYVMEHKGVVDTNIPVKSGQLLFIWAPRFISSSNKVWYRGYKEISVGEDVMGIFSLTPDYKFEFVSKNYATSVSAELAVNFPAIQKKMASLKKRYEYIDVLYDDFSSKQDYWVDDKSNWIFDTEFKTVTSISTGTPSDRDDNNMLELHKMYHADMRIMRMYLTLYSDTVLRVYGTRRDGSYEGQSCYELNCSNKKLILYKALTGADSYNNLEEYANTEISFDIVDGREYLIELEVHNYTYYFRIIDTSSGDIADVSCIGWDTGRMQGYYNFAYISGKAFSINRLRVSILKNPYIVFVGDSITEGVGMRLVSSQNKNSFAHRYAELIREKMDGKCLISAEGGDTILQCLEKFDSEFSFIKPKYISLCIGTNGRVNTNTRERYIEFIEKCESIGAFPLINLIPCGNPYGGISAYIAVNEMLLELSKEPTYIGKFKSCRFDIATAKDFYPWVDAEHPSTSSDGDTRWDTDKNADNWHPNYLGHKLMAERFSIDMPEILLVE